MDLLTCVSLASIYVQSFAHFSAALWQLQWLEPPSCSCIWSAPCTHHWRLLMWSTVQSSHLSHLSPNLTLMELSALYFQVSPYMTSLVCCTTYMLSKAASVVKCYMYVEYRPKQMFPCFIHGWMLMNVCTDDQYPGVCTGDIRYNAQVKKNLSNRQINFV